MPRAKRETALYRRGPYRLDWDYNGDGSRRPFLTVFWYDPERRKVRRASTGASDIEEGKRWLDAFYLERSTGEAVCPTCGQPRHRTDGYLLTSAIANYQTLHAARLPSADAIAARLGHVLDYLEAKRQAGATCERIDDAWVHRFRSWTERQPIVSPKGKERQRSLSTVEGSVAQLSAAINHAYRRGDASGPARFKIIPIKGLNRTPEHRSDVAELAAMFRYCIAPEAKDEEERERRLRERASLHRFLMISVATWARPDAAHDFSTEPKRRQWNSKARVLNLNPRGRRQTKKYRATMPCPYQLAVRLDTAPVGFFVGPQSVRKAWEGMAEEIRLPNEGEAGMKLIRRSIATIARQRLGEESWIQGRIMLGHVPETISDIYALRAMENMGKVLAVTEAIIAEIESLAPGAFHPTCTPQSATIVPLRKPANA